MEEQNGVNQDMLLMTVIPSDGDHFVVYSYQHVENGKTMGIGGSYDPDGYTGDINYISDMRQFNKDTRRALAKVNVMKYEKGAAKGIRLTREIDVSFARMKIKGLDPDA